MTHTPGATHHNRPHPAGPGAPDGRPTPSEPPVLAEVDMQIEGMTCASCVGHVERRLNKMPGVTAVVNLATERAKLTLTEDHTNQELEGAVTAAGYAGTVTRRRSSHDDDAHPGATTSPHASALSENDAVLPGAAGGHPQASGEGEGHAQVGGEHAVHLQAGGEHADHAPLSGHSHAGHGGGAVADTSDPSARRQADLKRRFLVAAVLTVPVMALSMAPPLQFPGWQWLVTALTLPVVVWAGLPFHKAAFNAARHGSSTMDTLVSLGTISATAWSLWALLFGGAGEIGMRMEMSLWPRAASEHGAHPELYFEVAAVVITFLLLGRWLESRSRRAAGDALRALAQMQPAEATKIVRAGSITREVRVPLAEIRVGDEFRVEPGEKIATDGTVTGGRSAVDASLLTGESVPVEVGPGDSVTGATLNTSGSLIVRATRVGEDTTLAQIGHLVEEAQVGKAPVQRIADQISAVFVPVVLVIAVITFVLWMVLGGTTQQAFTAAIAVLIIACPCALGLATPTALLAGTGRAAQRGILIRGPEVLEATRRIDSVILDKTGTLTTGVMTFDRVVALAEGEPGTAPAASTDHGPAAHGTSSDATRSAEQEALAPAEAEVLAQAEDEVLAPAEAEVLARAAAAESPSEHPIAKAIVRGAREAGLTIPKATDFTSDAGLGVTANVDGTPTTVGRLRHLREVGYAVDGQAEDALAEAEAGGGTAVAVGWDGRVRGIVVVRDAAKEGAEGAIAALKDLGIRPVLLTGDAEAPARAVAAAVGIEDVRAGVLPEEKRDVVAEFQSGGRQVAMVGDGVNDAAALAQAGTHGLGIAMGTGTDVAKEASDITIVSGDPRAVPEAISISRATLRVIKQNLFWAFAYNVAAIPLAALGLLNPMIAGVAMAFSSVLVVSNSLRLRHAGGAAEGAA